MSVLRLFIVWRVMRVLRRAAAAALVAGVGIALLHNHSAAVFRAGTWPVSLGTIRHAVEQAVAHGLRRPR